MVAIKRASPLPKQSVDAEQTFRCINGRHVINEQWERWRAKGKLVSARVQAPGVATRMAFPLG